MTTSVVGGFIWLASLRYKSSSIRALLSHSDRQFVLYYRGEHDPTKNKQIFFNPDKSIGGDSNQNEAYWEVKFGHLIIYSSGKELYSKFRWDKQTGRLVHVNDPRLPSVMGQYIVPLFIPASKNPDIYAKAK